MLVLHQAIQFLALTCFDLKSIIRNSIDFVKRNNISKKNHSVLQVASLGVNPSKVNFDADFDSVWVDSVRIKLSRNVPHTSRLKFVATF